MRFNDYYRKQSKKTLWDEVLDSEESLIDKLYKTNVNNLDPYFSLNDYNGKRYRCNRCGNEYEDNETEIYKGTMYCRECEQDLYYDG